MQPTIRSCILDSKGKGGEALDQNGEKRNAWKTVLFFCAIMAAFCIGDLLQEDIFFSESENRILAAKPKFSMETLLNGKYAKDYENYVNDQFVSRNTWIMLKTGTDIMMQKKAINGVYLAEDDYLIEQHLPQDFPQETIDKKLTLLKDLIKAYPQTKVLLAPTADNVLTDKLPMYAPYFDQRAFLGQVKEAIGEDALIDVTDTLAAHADEDIYYRTDHHWTTLGAYYAYRTWAEETGKYPIPYSTDELQAVTTTFCGTLQSKLNLPISGEEIRIFPSTLDRKITVTYDYGKKSNSFYEDSYLEGKNKYGYFLDDNHGLVEIENAEKNGKQLLIIKDSYANTMIPLLTPYYEKVYVLDLRYFNGKLLDFMQSCDEYGNMEVLVLYNCIHFIDDFRYY